MQLIWLFTFLNRLYLSHLNFFHIFMCYFVKISNSMYLQLLKSHFLSNLILAKWFTATLLFTFWYLLYLYHLIFFQIVFVYTYKISKRVYLQLLSYFLSNLILTLYLLFIQFNFPFFFESIAFVSSNFLSYLFCAIIKKYLIDGICNF